MTSDLNTTTRAIVRDLDDGLCYWVDRIDLDTDTVFLSSAAGRTQCTVPVAALLDSFEAVTR